MAVSGAASANAAIKLQAPQRTAAPRQNPEASLQKAV